jgi:hypothetical protein
MAVRADDVTLWAGRERLKGSVKDVSVSGMRLHLSRPVSPGQLLSVRQQDGSEYETVQARAAWCKPHVGRFEVGIELIDRPDVIDRSWVLPLIEQGGFVRECAHERRRTRRIPTKLQAVIDSTASRIKSRATIVDVSEGGVLLHTQREVDPGVYLRVASETVAGAPGFDLECRVIRVTRRPDATFRVSLQFVDPTAAQGRVLREQLRRLAA